MKPSAATARPFRARARLMPEPDLQMAAAIVQAPAAIATLPTNTSVPFQLWESTGLIRTMHEEVDRRNHRVEALRTTRAATNS